MAGAVMGRAPGTTVDARFERILRDRDVRTLFQPMVQLGTGAVVGYEALVRGPSDDRELGAAGSLLAAAHRTGRLVEFDWVARASACRAALDGDLHPDALLFLNIEPIALDSECPPDLWPVIEEAFRRFRVVLEVTERSLDRDPGTLLDGVERRRPMVAGIAIDDAGGHSPTLAMLPLVAPEVIKIDASVVGSRVDAGVAHVLQSIHEQAERTGAAIIAEGVETAAHRSHAMALGAQIGQGYYLGDAQPLLGTDRSRINALPLRRGEPVLVETPFEALDGRTIGRAGDDLMMALMHAVGACADVSSPGLHVQLLPKLAVLDPVEVDRLSRLASGGTFTAVLGPAIPAEPGYGIRGRGLRRDPQPIGEWAAITIGPCSSAAVLARRSGEDDGGWEYGITHERSRVVAAARSLVRLLGEPVPQFRFDG